MYLKISLVTANLLTNVAGDVDLARYHLEMRHEITFLAELLIAMRALEFLLVAVLHVLELFINRLEFRLANGA